MKKLLLAGAVALLSSPAFAGNGNHIVVPEMDAGAGLAAIALLVGVSAIIRERSKKK